MSYSDWNDHTMDAIRVYEREQVEEAWSLFEEPELDLAKLSRILGMDPSNDVTKEEYDRIRRNKK